jgi:hypothetical protein
MTDFDSKSQAGQDRFAFETSGQKRDGTFIDIGCAPPVEHSNTFALEQLGWRGLLVDILPCDGRLSRFLRMDVTNDISPILEYWDEHQRFVDYVSLDVDPFTSVIFQKIPWQLYKFGVMTVEHDRYARGDDLRTLVRSTMQEHGYRLARADVVAPGFGEYEDWFVHPQYP